MNNANCRMFIKGVVKVYSRCLEMFRYTWFHLAFLYDFIFVQCSCIRQFDEYWCIFHENFPDLELVMVLRRWEILFHICRLLFYWYVQKDCWLLYFEQVKHCCVLNYILWMAAAGMLLIKTIKLPPLLHMVRPKEVYILIKVKCLIILV